jgi:hypothetical protein
VWPGVTAQPGSLVQSVKSASGRFGGPAERSQWLSFFTDNDSMVVRWKSSGTFHGGFPQPLP